MDTTSYFPPSRLNPGRAWFVAKLQDDRSGLSWNTARNNIQAAVNIAQSGDTIYIAPGSYYESVEIKRGLTLMLIGVGPKGSVSIAPTVEHSSALICHSDNSLFQNLDFASPDVTDSVAFTATGNGLRCIGCKFEGAGTQVLYGPGTIAFTDLDLQGHGGDATFEDCEFAWGTNGVGFQGTDYGAATQVVIKDSLFHNLTASSITEVVGDGGSASVLFRNILIQNCSFEPAEDGTEPTAYLDLNGSNSNTGLVTGCRFTVSLTSSKNLVSTKMIWSGNTHPAGLSTGQPS